VESGTVQASSEAINGASANGAGAETIDVHNPATGGLVATVAVDPPAKVAETVARVRANQAEWEAIGIAGRRRRLGQLRDWLLDNSERIADTMQSETGKVRAEATTETIYLTDLINFYGAKASKFIGSGSSAPGTSR
jgi:acyl-CoA reductase-like NAD-dependent aldehyde dehydrogenase